MVLATVFFFATLSLVLVTSACYVFLAWVARNVPNSKVGKYVTMIPYFANMAQIEEVKRQAMLVGLEDELAPVQSKRTKRTSFRDARPPHDALKVILPTSGEEVVFNVAGTMKMVELWQKDDRQRSNPWTRTKNDFVFHVLKGKRDAWIFEGPGVLALITSISQPKPFAIQQFVTQARKFGQSDQRATDIAVEWDGHSYVVFDIGRLGVFEAVGEVPWTAAKHDFGSSPWPDSDQVKFLFAGPSGGNQANLNPKDPFLAVIMPVEGTGAFMLTGNVIDEQFLSDVLEEG